MQQLHGHDDQTRPARRPDRGEAIAEARFQSIANAMPQMVWSCLPKGSFDFFNQRWYDFTGLAPGTLSPQRLMDLHHPDDRARTEAAWLRSLSTGEPYEMECRLRHHSGDYRWVLGRALPQRGEGGEVLRWLGTCTDIHEQKQAQEALRESNQRKDEFLAMLAHELRNPLAPISTAAHLLRTAPQDAVRIQKAGELIERQVLHMTELVDDLLDVSRVTRGLVQIERQPILLQQVVQDALEQSRPQIEAHGHTVTLDIDDAPVHVEGDRIRLVQVLSNLLNNAAKYTPPGGHITLALQADGPTAELTVTDDGCGIDAQLLPHVFELFTQAQRTPDRSQGGLGVGLALVRSLLALHGGTVRARSAGRGSGSSFTVSLPRLLAVPAAPPLECPSPPVPRGEPLRILVVDDNADAADMLGIWLQAEGHQVTVVSDARCALAQAQKAPADVYVLDIGLPGMDGNELARQLRRDLRNRSATFIALTGYGQTQDILRSHEAGFDHHFVKPAEPQRLAAAMVAVPGGTRSRVGPGSASRSSGAAERAA